MVNAVEATLDVGECGLILTDTGPRAASLSHPPRFGEESLEPASQLFPSFELTVDKFHDHCGVFGVYGHPEAAKLAFLGLYALQHRGQESAGICSSDGDTLVCKRG